MTEPSTVRLAVPDDEPSLLALLRLMHDEVGIFSYSEDRTRETVHAILNARTHPLPMPAMIGVIGGRDDLQATVGLAVGRVYYTDDWHLGDLWTFVRPDCRCSDHGRQLLEFSKSMASHLGIKCMSGVVSTVRTEAKMRLYRRRFGTEIGGYFIFDPLKNDAA